MGIPLALRGRWTASLLLLTSVTASPPPAADAAEAEVLSVGRLTVQFPRRAASDGSLAGALSLVADFNAPASLASFDPLADLLRLTVGGVVLLDGPAFGGWARAGGNGSWDCVLSVRGAPGERSRVQFRLRRANGMLSVRARGVDLRPLLSAGPAGVAVALEIQGLAFSGTVDLDDSNPRRWTIADPGFTPAPPLPGDLTGTIVGSIYGALSPRSVGITVYRDRASWEAIWTANYSWMADPPPPPTADFAREMIVLVGAGPRYPIDPWVGGSSHNFYVRLQRVRPLAGSPEGLVIEYDLIDWFPSPTIYMPGEPNYVNFAVRVPLRWGTVEAVERYVPAATPPREGGGNW